MIHILLVSPDKKSLSGMLNTFDQKNTVVIWAESGSTGLAMVADKPFDLVVTDEHVGDMTGLGFVEKLITMNPMINCAAVSSISPEEYHEASEGLGLLMQLPVKPGQEEAGKLLDHLKNILTLTEVDLNKEGV